MEKKKLPKFKKGDTVIITIYGTVGNITDVKFINGSYVYEVNNSAGLYIESALKLYHEVEGELLIGPEHIDIELKFILGDLVQVEGYDHEFFIIVGYRTEIWRYKDNAWEEVIYELTRISDGEWLEANEEELTFIADAEQAEQLIEKLNLFHLSSGNVFESDSDKQVKVGEGKDHLPDQMEENQLIDRLLDVYNDYFVLYKWFGDKEYLKMMDLALLKMKEAVQKLNESD
jgi:hypothetical protein